jgi:PEP-CTERM motif
MRRCVSVAVFAILLLTGRTAFADSVGWHDTLHVRNVGGEIYGGVFWVDDLTTGSLIDTFCLQHEDDISIDDYRVESTGLVTDDGDPLDARTAWIYSTYRAGTLPTHITENDIQAAIWLIEEELTLVQEDLLFAPLLPNLPDHVQELITAAEKAISKDGWANTDVRVMSFVYLTGGDHHSAGDPAQDLLFIDSSLTTQDVHMPEPTTLILVGSGVAGLIRRHSKRRRTS